MSNTQKKQNKEFKLNQLDRIGDASAEEDNLLRDCFIDNGYIETISDINDNRRILVGRTGSGKTAIINTIRHREEYASLLNLNLITINHLINAESTHRWISESGDLSLFIKIFWIHIFTIEIIRSILSKKSTRFFGKMFQGRDLQESQKYLENWGERFWKEDEYKIIEIINRIDNKTTAGASAKAGDFGASAERSKSEHSDTKTALHKSSSHYIYEPLIKEMQEVKKHLANLITDQQKKHYLLIDGLDELHIERSVQIKLIRGLIEAVRFFKEIPNCKLVVAIRHDLLESTLWQAKSAGFQSEKYESIMLNLTWTQDKLREVVDTRIASMISRRYNSKTVGFDDIFPSHVDREPTWEWMLSRTLMRPRDIIMFVNMCIERVNSESIITTAAIKEAEEVYSESRLRAIYDEWRDTYPHLDILSLLLKNTKQSFGFITFREKVENACLEMLSLQEDTKTKHCPLLFEASEFFEGRKKIESVALEFIKVLAFVGLVNIRPKGKAVIDHGQKRINSIQIVDLGEDISILVHPAFRRYLNSKP